MELWIDIGTQSAGYNLMDYNYLYYKSFHRFPYSSVGKLPSNHTRNHWSLTIRSCWGKKISHAMIYTVSYVMFESLDFIWVRFVYAFLFKKLLCPNTHNAILDTSGCQDTSKYHVSVPFFFGGTEGYLCILSSSVIASDAVRSK